MFIDLSVFMVSVTFISVVNSDFEEYGQTTAPDIEEELHMDNVPTGYLPDSVYRELAWYGILQIQPLYHSTKHKVAARWIWQNTLGRPYVVLENSPQATESEGKGGQNLMEESAKWVRDQRSAADVLMENIRAGGNGLTVRTVISSTKKSVYIIQNGNTYECGVGSEPDIDAFRAQSNMHERRCTEDKEPKLVSLDICMDAEFTPVEYSYVDGWNFCMGDGDRETSYTADGDLDCGKKKKVSFDRFLEECSIDGNVVITFDYFGDEPRKDLIRNTTICTSWDPCRFSYLYRIEVSDNDKPDIPTTTPDPCDTTFCPECLENYTEETFIADEDHKNMLTDHNDGLLWVQVTNDDFSKYTDKGLDTGGNNHGLHYIMRAPSENMILPGELYKYKKSGPLYYRDIAGRHIYVNDSVEMAIQAEGSKLEWVLPGNKTYDNAVQAGIGEHGQIIYLCFIHGKHFLKLGYYYDGDHKCTQSQFKNVEEYSYYKVLINAAKPIESNLI